MSWLPPLALVLDLLLADPLFPPHPVRGIGLMAQRLETPARRLARLLREFAAPKQGSGGIMPLAGIAKGQRPFARPRHVNGDEYGPEQKKDPEILLEDVEGQARGRDEIQATGRTEIQTSGRAEIQATERDEIQASGRDEIQASGRAEILAGGLALAVICLTVTSLAALLCALPGFFGVIAALYLSFAGLAFGSLLIEGEVCLTLIKIAQKEPIAMPAARAAVQKLVSRDTGAMDAPELYRSLAESLSENLNDAFGAPFFWLCLSGPVGLWFYKAASTMDSMWGYKNERFLYLGRASARLDDLLAFVPARISAALLLFAAWTRALPENLQAAKKGGPAVIFQVPGWPGWAALRAQARQGSSPNAPWPMASAAWLLQGRCGGPTSYEGKILDKPLLGPPDGCWEEGNTRALIGLLRRCGWLCLPPALLLIGL